MRVTSEAFVDGQPIPVKYTADGQNVSPPLQFHDVPEGVAELALICDDPDAPTDEPFVHWVIYGLPGETRGLPEGVGKDANPAQVTGAIQGVNSFGENQIGYGGPAPPPGHGTHHYYFKLYALDQALDLGPGASKAKLLDAMANVTVLDEAQLVGTYER